MLWASIHLALRRAAFVYLESPVISARNAEILFRDLSDEGVIEKCHELTSRKGCKKVQSLILFLGVKPTV